MTTTWTREGQVAVFIAVDHHNAECVGIHAARQSTRFEALEPLRQRVRQHFGVFAKGVVLSIRHDHGSNTSLPSSRTSWRSWGPKAPRPSSGHQKAMAARSGSSAR
jgi:hypothetical protein